MSNTTDLPKGVRQTKSGSYELTLSHTLIPGGRVYRNFPSPEAAGAYKERMLTVLEMGVLPAELTRSGAYDAPTKPPERKKPPAPPVAATRRGTQSVEMKELIKQYLESDTAQISKTDRPLVEKLGREISGSLDGVKTAWVDAWVRHMKQERQMAPGTIRKNVESLARAIDWWNRREFEDGDMPANVLRLLPRGYSTYSPNDTKAGVAARTDAERDRRLTPGEYDLIEKVLQGYHVPGKERPYGQDRALLMLFRLIVHTALRLREAYKIRLGHIRLDLSTIHIPNSKTGTSRDVPITPQLEAWLKEFIGARKDPQEPLLPYWLGMESEDILRLTTARLSARFSSLFSHCGIKDLVEHDLRHEGTCRWMTMRDREGRWLFRSEEVQRITGHKNAAQFRRYLSLRGSEFADRIRGMA